MFGRVPRDFGNFVSADYNKMRFFQLFEWPSLSATLDHTISKGGLIFFSEVIAKFSIKKNVFQYRSISLYEPYTGNCHVRHVMIMIGFKGIIISIKSGVGGHR